ncbi:MAG: sugar-binding domain-containing protein, partial [Sphingobacteriales bacterium]
MPFNQFIKKAAILAVSILFTTIAFGQGRTVADFDSNWHFHLGDVNGAELTNFNDASWRNLNLPHDWSIEGKFSKDNPATPEGGALPGGIGWYRKTFIEPASAKTKRVYIDFDGVYQKSTVWINGHKLGFRPNGYISFRYELTPYLNFGGKNTIVVKVDNSVQPNSRWYSGSGIYRNVWLVATNKTAVSHWGTYVTTPQVSDHSAQINIKTSVLKGAESKVDLETSIVDESGRTVKSVTSAVKNTNDTASIVNQNIEVRNPILWSVERPYLYKVISKILSDGKVLDTYTTSLGIRYFNFDADKGFS